MNEKEFESLLYTITSNTVNKIMELNGWNEDEAMEQFTLLLSVAFVNRILYKTQNVSKGNSSDPKAISA